MNRFISRSNRNRASFAWWSSVVALTVLTPLVASTAGAQTWTYQSYRSGQGGSSSAGDRYAPGYVTLDNKGGQATFVMSAGTLDRCYRGELDATVAKTEATTIITNAPPLTGCIEVRFVIKNDGTGGQREVKRDSDWVWDGFDRGLTLRK
jgi:hypothetical protein